MQNNIEWKDALTLQVKIVSQDTWFHYSEQMIPALESSNFEFWHSDQPFLHDMRKTRRNKHSRHYSS